MNEFAYFDHAATSFPKLPKVLKFANDFTKSAGVNAGRGQYDLAARAGRMINETRDKLVYFLGGTSDQTAAFTPSATSALNMVIQGQEFSSGQTVYLSRFEHNAVLRTVEAMRKRFDLKVKFLAMCGMKYDLDGIMLNFAAEPPDFVICTHASNVCGVIAPIKQLCDLSRQYGAVNIIDMSQTAGLLELDLKKIKADFYIFAGHKTLLSLYGVGGFICDRDAKLSCLLYGGTGNRSADIEMPGKLPERCEPGSLNTHAIASLSASIDYIEKTGRQKLWDREKKNRDKLMDILYHYENIHIVGENQDAVGIISCVFDHYSPDNIGNVLNRSGVAVRTGLHCAPEAHRFLGTYPSGTVRFSINPFTTQKEFELLKNGLDIIHNS